MYKDKIINENVRVRVLPHSKSVAMRMRRTEDDVFYSAYLKPEEWKVLVAHVEHEQGEGSTDEE